LFAVFTFSGLLAGKLLIAVTFFLVATLDKVMSVRNFKVKEENK
jgi:hypothetical protein